MDPELIKQEAARLFHKYVDPTSASPLKLALLPKTAAGIEQGLAVPSQELFRNALEEGARLCFFLFLLCSFYLFSLVFTTPLCLSLIWSYCIFLAFFCHSFSYGFCALVLARAVIRRMRVNFAGFMKNAAYTVAMGALLLNERYHVPDAFFKHFLAEYCQAGDDSWQLIEEKVRPQHTAHTKHAHYI